MPPARPVALLLASLSLVPAARAAPADPATAAPVVAAAEREGKLVVYSTTDSVYAAPVLKDFQSLHPRIAVEYDDMSTTEVYNRFIAEAAAGSGTGDVLWSSSMDLQVKLASDGYAQAYDSPEAPSLPSWAVWKREAFGTTYEPISFVYNKRLLEPREVPQSHAELVKALQANPDRFRGKLAVMDPERSGLGYLLLAQDARNDPAFDVAAAAYGRAGVRTYPGTGAMLERILSGEHLIGFNVIGSYALARQKRDPAVGIVHPRDYTLVITRIALIPRAARHPNAAKVFLDYLLSARGQDAIARAGLFAIRGDVSGEATSAELRRTLGAALRPIPVGPELLEDLDPAKRLAFLARWQKAIGTK